MQWLKFRCASAWFASATASSASSASSASVVAHIESHTYLDDSDQVFDIIY